MGEWRTIRLDDGLERLIDYRGKSPPKSTAGIPVISAKVVKSGRIIQPIEQTIEADFYKVWMTRGFPLVSDVVMTTEGPLGEVAQLDAETVKFALGQRVVCMRGKKGVLDNTFLKFLLMSPIQQGILSSYATGTTVAGISQKSLRSIPITIPPYREQVLIGAVLGALDDKIDLNRHMNETLDAMARAIYKDWFVDFGPTRAKMEGRPPYLTPEIWRLFPDRLDADGVPEGWHKSSIYEFANVIYGAPFASSQFNSKQLGTPLVRIRDLTSESPGVWTTEAHPKGYKVQPGDVVVGMDGEFRAHLWGGSEAWLNQRLCVFAPKRGCSAAFVRNSIIGPLAQVEETETATTVIHLGKNDIDRFSVTSPTDATLSAFNDVCQPTFDLIVANKRETHSLTVTRDLLLPKLMSGEIHVKEGEKIAEAAA